MRKLSPLLLPLLLTGCGAPSVSRVDPNEVIGIYREPPPAVTASPTTGTPNAAPPASGGVWTVEQVKEWYSAYVKKEKGGSIGLLYQGSDSRHHYFTARIPSTQSWISMTVLKTQVRVEREMPDRHKEQPVRGYGFVDPFNGFRPVPKVGNVP